MVDAVEFMLADQDQVARLQRVYIIFDDISGIPLQKQEHFVITVIMELKICIGGNKIERFADCVAGFHKVPPSVKFRKNCLL